MKTILPDNILDFEKQLFDVCTSEPTIFKHGDDGILFGKYEPVIEAIAATFWESTGLLRIAYRRKDGFYEYRMIQRRKEWYSNIVHHFFERPSDLESLDLMELIGWVCPQKAFSEVWEKVKKNRILFKLPDSGRDSVPFGHLHYWAWLTINEPEGNHNRIITRDKYLNSLGFNIYKHVLSSEDLEMLKYTLEYHWNFYFRPNKKAPL